MIILCLCVRVMELRDCDPLWNSWIVLRDTVRIHRLPGSRAHGPSVVINRVSDWLVQTRKLESFVDILVFRENYCRNDIYSELGVFLYAAVYFPKTEKHCE